VSRTRIKFCGITRLEDAMIAANAGGNAIGMIFHEPSPRHIDPDVAYRIVTALPPFVTPVGVFVDEDAETIVELAADLGLHTVQLNGDESPAMIRDLEGLSVIKAIHVDAETIESDLDEWRNAILEFELDNLSGFVLEPARTGQPGGSGVANDWETVRRQQERGNFEDLPPLVAAGGLTPETVADVVRKIRPWAVDVSSGVEQSRGVKSAEKILAFVEAVRAADHSM
jgi:phosphoribosylanthranilate isomerase